MIDRHEPQTLLEKAKLHLTLCLEIMIGMPGAALAKAMLPRPLWRDMMGWLRALEALARRLVLARAAAFADAKDVVLARPRARRMRAPLVEPYAADCACAWRGVHFALFPRTPSKQRIRRRGAPQRRAIEMPALRLAIRLEAARRAIAAPDLYARRAARRLRGNPDAGWTILREPKGLRPTHAGGLVLSAHDGACAEALARFSAAHPRAAARRDSS